MINKSSTILTKKMIIKSEQERSVPEKLFSSVCNVHMNRINISPTLDTHQEHNAFTSDGIKERCCPIDRLQTHRTNLHQSMDHSSERKLKLNPYVILNTDPTLENVNYSNALSRSPRSLGNKKEYFTIQSMYEAESKYRRNYNNSRQWEENDKCKDQKELKYIDLFNNISIQKYDMDIKQPPVYCQPNILPTEPPEPLISTNYLMNIANQKSLVNHAELATLMYIESKEIFNEKNIKDTSKVNESLMISKEDKQIPNSDTYGKETEKLYDQNSITYLTSLGIQNQKDNYKCHSALRPSLFSNMPPYIRFSSHDIKGESFPLCLQNVLKWKLSSITPVVVRRTIQNSGFKLVRSDHSLVENAIDPSVKTNESNQSAISLQNNCNVTPTIVDDVTPPPNELMMLPLSEPNDWVGTWGKHMKSLCFKTLREQQKLNHFPGTFQIGRKDRLWKNFHTLMSKYGKEQFGFVPISYILPQETKILRQVWEKNDKDKWIVKPPASYRGTGIRVISKWGQIPKNVPLVVQRYIDNPYLINDTKFDLRLYILITSINPLRLYLYDNGLVRFASVKYSSDLTTICDRYMHLTNYSINRLSSQYTENEDADACQGHKWTLRSLWTYMEKEHQIDVKKLQESLEDVVVKTIISGESPMSQMCRSNLNNRYNAYELFGIDVLFDEYLKPWILEVNISPSLHSSSPLDLAVKGPLVKDLLNMAGYHIPNQMSRSTHNTLLKMLGVKLPLCYDKRLYTFNLSAKENEKQEYYTNVESREEYIDNILDDLLPDDIRHLILYEDELTQIGSFQKVFPTTSSFKYHQYFDGSRYYNMLFDAWECKYSNNREEGIALLEKLCQLQVHLEVPDIDEEQSKVIY